MPKTPKYPRYTFETAIGDARLFKKVWLGEFSDEQRAVMRMFYGLPLDSADMAIWHALHGGGVYDDLYRLKSVHDSGVPYVEGLEYTDITLISGRRAAKSCIGSFCSAYEAICGGHKQRLIIEDQDPVFLFVSQDLTQATSTMRSYMLHYLKSSPAGAQILSHPDSAVTQRQIHLEGCGNIRVGPPNIKVGRGDSTACAVLDENAYWQSDEKSAAPDFEVERAIEYGMSQFSPYAKKFKLTSPYTEEGLAWKDSQIGTRGRFLKDPDPSELEGYRHKLVLHGPSPVLKNPTITTIFLTEKRAKDPDAFDREIGAKFSKAIAGFLNPALVKRAIDSGVTLRPKELAPYYVAAMDPAFKNDAFPLCIGHLESPGTFVQDFLITWRGTYNEPLNPGDIMPLVGDILKSYGIKNVMSDQHHLESLQTLAQQSGFLVEPFYLTSKSKNDMWRDFVTLLGQNKIRLVDSPVLYNELISLERTITPNKVEKIQGKRDDHAVVTAMCCHRALQFGVASEPKQIDDGPVTPEGIAAVLKLRADKARKPKLKPKAWWVR